MTRSAFEHLVRLVVLTTSGAADRPIIGLGTWNVVWDITWGQLG
jgi:hypothetical protein